ncbi:microtubule associated protein xmap215, putative [Perkinsus marinus ATCC 50983]|uniref:Microtubule associated protein xmap215, putative n=1 Tax=Perkinsus marinus (strain ATCC 50983 / TXsc) TaxID=423536 RepID=C5LPC0_PERM5|nr:microtubule associated protein xmap215, putative [Perkinsus marinus ATCC 50983]EER01423.1 microtubule associated protein xmap215, putative [Perkinsus marinus ATCC 50983]|eukprot:XP_002768705.1 microtubule associated protein xmap215, putative [Perkinsus marinus ATCC 50983]
MSASVVTSETNPRSQEGACKAIAACTGASNFNLGPFLAGLLEKYISGNQKIQGFGVECLAKAIEGQEGLSKEVMEGVCGHAKGLLKPPKGKKMPAKGVTNKQLSGCLAALTSLLEAFGTTVIPPKEFLSLGVEACGSTDRGVKEAGYTLLVELYQWLPDVEACGNGLADNQMKEFKTRCERLGECQPKTPTRFAFGVKLPAEGATGAVSPGAVAQSTEDAAYDMLQPQDIFKMLPKDFVSQVTSATKWVEKRDAIGQLTALAKKHKKMVTAAAALVGPKVRDGHDGPCRSALCAVANGLRGEMPHSRMLLLTMLTKIKEKNAGVLRQAIGCIDALLKYQSLSLDNRLVEDLAGVINDKNPIGRREVLGICSRALPFVSADLLLPMAETVLLPCLDESDKTVREAACTLGDLVGVVLVLRASYQERSDTH